MDIAQQRAVRAAQAVQKEQDKITLRAAAAKVAQEKKISSLHFRALGENVRFDQRAAAQASKAQEKLNKDLEKQSKQAKPFGGAIGEGLQKFTQRLSGPTSILGRFAATLGVTTGQLAIFFGSVFSGAAILLLLGAAIKGVVSAAKAFAKFIGESVVAASNLREAASSVIVTFKSASTEVINFAKNAQGLGLSTAAALDAARGFASLFRNAGFTRRESAQLSVTFSKLAADVAAFSNVQGGAEEVAKRFRSAIAGNLESLDALGQSLRFADIENQFLREGIIKTRGEMNSELATIGISIELLERFQDATGANAREALGFAASTNRLNASLTNFKATVGAAFEPIAAFVAQVATGFIKALEKMAVLAIAVGGALKDVGGIVEFLKTQFAVLFPFLSATIGIFAEAGREALALADAERKADLEILRNRAKVIAQLTELQKAYDNATENIIRYAQAVIAQRDSEIGLSQAHRAVTQAEQGLLDARRATITLLHNITSAEISLDRARIEQARSAFFVADAERAVHRAREGILDAQRDFLRAQEDIVIAQENLVEVQRELASNLPIREATLRFAEAQLRLKEESLGTARALQEQLDAQLALLDAEFDLERAQRRGRAGARDQLRSIIAIQRAQLGIADAALAPERAQISLARSTIDLEQAEVALQKVMSGETGRRQLRDAERQLEDAHIRVRDAANAIIDSQVALRNANFQLQGSYLDVRDANLGVLTAQEAVFTSRQALERQAGVIRDAELSLASAENAVNSAGLQAAVALDELRVAQAALKGETIPAEERLRLFLGTLNDIGIRAPAIAGLIRLIETAVLDIPTKHEIEILINQRDALDKLAEAKNTVGDAAKEVEGKLKGLFKTGLGELKQFLKSGVGNLVQFIIDTVVPIPGLSILAIPLRNALRAIEGFEHGGRIHAGQLGLVGEKGPELFVPRSPGFVIPADLTASLFALTRILGGVTPTLGKPESPQILNFNEGAFALPQIPDYRVLAVAIARELGRKGNR